MVLRPTVQFFGIQMAHEQLTLLRALSDFPIFVPYLTLGSINAMELMNHNVAMGRAYGILSGPVRTDPAACSRVRLGLNRILRIRTSPVHRTTSVGKFPPGHLRVPR